MNDRVIVNPKFKNRSDLERSLVAQGIGAKGWPDTCAEVEYLGEENFGASITVGHSVFFDKADGNKPKKHKLTDERPAKDCILIQSAKCCVEVYPYYAKYFDVQHEEVRLYEERWIVQRWRSGPNKWFDVGAWNPVMVVEEYSEPAGDVVKVTVTYDTDYGILTVEYFQRDGNALKHNVTFQNTSGGVETFRVLQRWAGIVGSKCNGKDIPVVADAPFLAFHKADKPQREFNIAENLHSMMFDARRRKTEHCLQGPVKIESHAQGMKADFIYGNWVLAQNESLAIDPATATLDNPAEDGSLMKSYEEFESCVTKRPLCFAAAPVRNNTAIVIDFGGYCYEDEACEGYRGYIEWDISSLAGATLTANPVFKYHGYIANGTSDEINPLTEEQPSNGGCTDANLWDYIGSGTAYVDPFNIELGETKEVDLGVSAKTDLQAAMTAAQSWFAIGLQTPDDECPGFSQENASLIYSEEKTDAANPKPTLYVEYTPAAVGLENKTAHMAAKMVAAGLI